jgi:two-component system, NtrC family, sensor histidine kinase HydH
MAMTTNRATVLAVAILCLALAAVTGGTIETVRKEQARAVDQFTSERLRAVESLAREMDKDFASIGDALGFAGRLFVTAETEEARRRELGALLRVVKQYRMVAVYDRHAARSFEVRDASADLLASELYPDLQEVARHALVLPPGQIEASAPFAVEGGGWFRAFASSFAGADGQVAGAVAMLVDTEPLFGKVRLIVADAGSRLLVLGAHGMATPASTAPLAAAVTELDARRDGGRTPGFAALVARMRAGDPAGTLRIGDREAARLGLAAAEVVAAYAPVPFRGGHWSVATLDSTAPLRAYQRTVFWRLTAAGGAIALCLLLLSTYVVIASRRAVALRERLRHAAQVERILDNVPAGVMVLSREKRVKSVNRALRERLADDPVGRDLAQAFPQAPEAVAARVAALVTAALASGREHDAPGEHLSLFGAEGQYSLHAVPLDEQVLLVIDDLSEVRSLESRLLAAEKLATIGVLAAGIAHEIGTPLGVVRGRAEYLLGKSADGSPHAAGMQVMIEQIDRVARIIRQLLDFSRVKPAVARPTALLPAVRAAAELVRFEAERRRVELSVVVPDGLPPLLADPDQLQQVIINLAMNACDSGARRVTIGARREAVGGATPWQAVRIEVVDDGCGIPAEHRHQVFDPFFTTKKRGEGTGLGLTVASQIVRNHGGEIELTSAAERGTRASVLWPAAPAAGRSPETEARHAAG